MGEDITPIEIGAPGIEQTHIFGPEVGLPGIVVNLAFFAFFWHKYVPDVTKISWKIH